MDDVVNGIINDKWISSPRLVHILNFWKLRHLPNICFITYEDLVRNPLATVKVLCKFLGRAYTDDQLNGLIEFISFDNMRQNSAINRENTVVEMEILSGKKRFDATYT